MEKDPTGVFQPSASAEVSKLAGMPTYQEFDEARRAGTLPGGVRDRQDYDEYVARQRAYAREAISAGENSDVVPKDAVAELATGDQGVGNIYDREFREETNIPSRDLFARRRKIILDRYPTLREPKAEDIRKYHLDAMAQAQREKELGEVPKSVSEEYYLLSLMIDRLESGIQAYLHPGETAANGEPNYVPKQVDASGQTFISTIWKAKETEADLAKLSELHEKNAGIIDFSQEQKVDIDTFPAELSQRISALEERMKELETAKFADFEPVGGQKPKVLTISEISSGLKPEYRLSFAAERKLSEIKDEYVHRYLTAFNAAELRDIDERIDELQKEKERVAERQKRYARPGIAGIIFRLLKPGEAKTLEQTLAQLDDKLNEESQYRAERFGSRPSQAA